MMESAAISLPTFSPSGRFADGRRGASNKKILKRVAFLIAAVSQRGFNPRPAQVSVDFRDCGI
jgi:hypothetical protein